MTENSKLKILISAITFAAEKHRSQRRKDVDGSPYINHPIALANVLATKGNVADLTVLCAAILHDTIEDTETNEDELRELFGDEITNVVLEVTDDKKLSKVQRKQLQIIIKRRGRLKPFQSFSVFLLPSCFGKKQKSTLIILEHHVWHEPQPHEPPSADPHARWCDSGAVMLTAPPIPMELKKVGCLVCSNNG